MSLGEEVVTTRITRWVAEGYEDAFTKYQVCADGSVWVTGFALRNNIAGMLGQGIPKYFVCATVDEAETLVHTMIDSKSEHTVEITFGSDTSLCSTCGHGWEDHTEVNSSCSKCGCTAIHTKVMV